MSKTVVLIDASPLLYSNFNQLVVNADPRRNLQTSTGISTGLRYGFLRSIISQKNKHKANAVVICYDMNVNEFPLVRLQAAGKSAEISEYKANRIWTQDKQDMYDMVPDLKKMLAYTNFTQIESPGYEADDLLAYVAKRFVKEKPDVSKVIIVSSDNDMCAAVTDKIFAYTPQKDAEKPMKDRAWVHERFGVYPEQFHFLKAATGDPSDNVAPVLKVKSELEAFRKDLGVRLIGNGTLEDLYAEISATQRLPYAESLALNWKEFEYNYRLMCFYEPEKINIVKGTKNRAALTEIFQELEFNSYLNKPEKMDELVT